MFYAYVWIHQVLEYWSLTNCVQCGKGFDILEEKLLLKTTFQILLLTYADP